MTIMEQLLADALDTASDKANVIRLLAQVFATCGRDPAAWNGETRKLVELALEIERQLPCSKI